MSGLHALAPDGDSDDERTTVVDRSAPVDDHDGTVVVDRRGSDDGNETVVVDRAARPARHDNETVVVDRTTADDDNDDNDNETIVVERSVPASPADGGDGTIVVPRQRPRASTASKGAPAPGTGRRGRRRITLPPVEPGFAPDPVEAVGPGAVSSYAARGIQPVPAGAPAVPLGADATRAPAPSMPSVGRRSRSFGMIAVGGFGLACVVSIVGLGAIIASLVG